MNNLTIEIIVRINGQEVAVYPKIENTTTKEKQVSIKTDTGPSVKQIKDYLRGKDYVNVKQIAEHFHVTSLSIGRRLAKERHAGRVIRYKHFNMRKTRTGVQPHTITYYKYPRYLK